jgi:hypothetical protein
MTVDILKFGNVEVDIETWHSFVGHETIDFFSSGAAHLHPAEMTPIDKRCKDPPLSLPPFTLARHRFFAQRFVSNRKI